MSNYHIDYFLKFHLLVRLVALLRRRYQRGNQNPYIKEEQTTQWPKEKVKRTNNDQQNIHIKLKIEYYEPH
jgi:hypothetical protein